MSAPAETISRRQWWCLSTIILFAAVIRFYAAVATPLVYDEGLRVLFHSRNKLERH